MCARAAARARARTFARAPDAGVAATRRRPRRLLKYWSGSRCCGFWRWPRRERSADIRSDLGQASNAGQRQNQRNRHRREAEGQLAASLGRYSPLRGCASLASCHLPFCLYAQPALVFQQSPRLSGADGSYQGAIRRQKRSRANAD